tara:strand:+ start:279 stop:446 length:168 start_codon:yes stop_codon:yes gene_type:complete
MKSLDSFIKLDGRRIVRILTIYIVAEISATQNGKVNKTIRSLKISINCGADALKV